MPTFAYSIARDLVAALNPPLVSEASKDGTLEVEVRSRHCRDLHDVAAMPRLHLCHHEMASCVI